jgi:hypothetical protein
MNECKKSARIDARASACTITISDGSCIPLREVRLPPVPRDVVFALANELRARGFLVDVPAQGEHASHPRVDHPAHDVLRALGLEPPYQAYDAAIEHQAPPRRSVRGGT